MAALAATVSGVLVWCLAVGQAQPGPAARAAGQPKPAGEAGGPALVAQLRQENAGLKARVAQLEGALRAAQPKGTVRPSDELRKLFAQDAADRNRMRDDLTVLSKALKTAVENERASRADIARVRRELDGAKQQLAAHGMAGKQAREELADVKYRFTLLQKRNTQLAEQLKTLSQQMQQMESRTGGPAATGTDTREASKGRGAAKLKVSGLVKQVDYKNSLVMVSIGSDDGVKVGQTLVVFRSGAPPVFLGAVEVVAVKPDESVGRISRQTRPEAFRVGDRVAREVRE